MQSKPNRDLRALGSLLARPLDFWGVQEQRLGNLADAARFFERTIELNPDNVIAKINLECNKNLRAGRKATVQLERTVEEDFGRFRSWDQIMNEDGPFDEPTFCFKQGLVLAGQSLYRQAANEFGRVHDLAPENIYARLWLAQLYVLGQMPDQALKVIDELHAHPKTLAVPRTNANELLYVEMSAHLAKKDVAGAERTVAAILEKYPSDEELISSAAQVFINFGCFSNALPVLDRQLKLQPGNMTALLQKGVSSLQTGAYDEAIAALTKVLSVETNSTSELHNNALLSRAIAYLRSDKFEESQQDYETLQKSFPTAYRIYFGLGEIAYRRKDTNSAIRNYQLYLTNSPANPDEIKTVHGRLKELQPTPQ